MVLRELSVITTLGAQQPPKKQGSRETYCLSSFYRIFASSVGDAVTESKIAPSVESNIHQHRKTGTSPVPPPTVTAPSCLFRGISADLSNLEQNLNVRAVPEILRAECGLKTIFIRGYC